MTTLATHDGPKSCVPVGWSEFMLSGTTHDRLASVPFETSLKTFVSGLDTFVVHSGPSRTASMASKAFQFTLPLLMEGE